MDYSELVKDLRYCASGVEPCEDCKRIDTIACEPILMSEAADAIEELEQIAGHYEETAKDYFKDVCYYLERVPKWIPVTEQLPEEYVNVLCYSRNKQYGCGEWSKEDNGTIYWIGLNGMIPTHWMPLPEPPKEETE